MKKILSIFSFLACGFWSQAQETVYPAPAQSKKIIISGATLHLGNGQVLPNASLILEKGKIKRVEGSLSPSPDAEFIDAKGKHVYPGIIAPNTNLGLVEVSSTKSTADYFELGEMHPNVRSIVAYNTDSKVINTLRSNGILLAQIVPQGGMLPGSSTVVQLDAWNWEDAAYALDGGVHLVMPALINMPQSNPRRGEVVDRVKLGLEKLAEARRFFREAKAYLQEKVPAETNIKFEATRGLFEGKKTFFVHCDLVKEILAAIDFAKEFGFKLVIVGGSDAWMIADVLRENQVAVILPEPHSLPATEDDPVDLPYKTGVLLHKAGVLFTICQDSGDGYTQQRNLPFQAGTLSAYGLTKEEALQVITLNAAKILGISDRTGSLEDGKDANLLISSGDLLDMKSSKVEAAFIQGRRLDLNNKHRQLAERFQKKYQLKP